MLTMHTKKYGDFVQCQDCGEWIQVDDLWEAYRENGERVKICEDCFFDKYPDFCEACGKHFPKGMVKATNKDGHEIWVCKECEEG